MSFVLTEEQLAIARTAKHVVREYLPVTQLRALRDDGDPVGLSPDAWRALAEVGVAGMTIAEQYGGAGLGWRELGLVAEECGHTLAATPLLSTTVLGAGAIELGGSDAHKRDWLPRVSRGDALLAFALDEDTRFAPGDIALTATANAGDFVLDGEKQFVLDGHIADAFVVVATGPDDGLSLFLVPAGAEGVHAERRLMVDSRNAASVRFDQVQVAEADALGPIGGAADIVSLLCDRAAAVLAAEMLGGMCEAFDRTLAYLKERKQFGVVIGSFQALKHRTARMFCEIELTKSIVAAALQALDDGADDAPMLVSTAKARASDSYLLVAAEAIQMHGGIGVTDELDIGLFYKRARVAELSFGDAAYHRDRFACLLGY